MVFFLSALNKHNNGPGIIAFYLPFPLTILSRNERRKTEMEKREIYILVIVITDKAETKLGLNSLGRVTVIFKFDVCPNERKFYAIKSREKSDKKLRKHTNVFFFLCIILSFLLLILTAK